ncbi:hypothetical protein [Shewanella pneumatophori]|uniref:Uncharacterized protein n=1 Tax=Shewanella pneumatophori TaxID=314092 RepID=A0A9X2CIW3_9GAMM|nr:hypothetical protein [Shewanella pneumatophori]MCL1140225.1 hypothetical protein [Shewanella pneumatophori]
MKDLDQTELESNRPGIDVLDGINYCLEAFYNETLKSTDDFAVNGLKFQEIIGVLLLAKDDIERN